MKKIKISLFAIIAIVMGVAGSAFTNSEPLDTRAGINWYIFEGNQNSLSDILNNQLYTYVPSKPCNSVGLICGVNAEGSKTQGAHPDSFSDDLIERLEAVFYNPAPDALIAQEQ